jgi:hypothetical protein
LNTAQNEGYYAPNEMLMAHLQNFLMNPGQVSTIAYERAQEQIGGALNNSLQNIVGSVAGSGIDPTSASSMGQMQSSILNAGRLRAEAARDQSLIEEQLRRQDIGTGADLYMNMLNYITQLQNARAQAAAGTGFAPAQAVNPYGSLAQGIGQAGQYLGEYFTQRSAAKTKEGE